VNARVSVNSFVWQASALAHGIAGGKTLGKFAVASLTNAAVGLKIFVLPGGRHVRNIELQLLLKCFFGNDFQIRGCSTMGDVSKETILEKKEGRRDL